MILGSPKWIESFKDKCNASQAFQVATRFADVKVVFMFGESRQYFKIYKGKIIDSIPFERTWDPLGYDICLRGPMDAWESVAQRKAKFWDHLNSVTIEVGGNHAEANKLHEALLIMCQDVLPTV